MTFTVIGCIYYLGIFNCCPGIRTLPTLNPLYLDNRNIRNRFPICSDAILRKVSPGFAVYQRK